MASQDKENILSIITFSYEINNKKVSVLNSFFCYYKKSSAPPNDEAYFKREFSGYYHV